MATPITVTRYRAKDGRDFATEIEAEIHEALGELIRLVDTTGVGGGGLWSPDMFRDWMIEHAARLAPCLTVIAGKEG